MRLIGSHWKGWDVWLEDGQGRRLNEYNIEYLCEGVGDTRIAKVHVECEDGQEFSICARAAKYITFDWHMIPKVDGRDIEGYALYAHHSRKPSKVSTCFEEIDGIVRRCKLVFNKINRVEDGPRLDASTATQLGTIELLLKGGTNVRATTPYMPWASPKPVDTIDEKLKKVALSSYISGGAVVDTPGPRYGNYLQEDPKIPKYKIIFSYATRPVLELKGIIPTPRAAQEPAPLPRIASPKKDRKQEKDMDKDKTATDKKKKRKSTGDANAEAGPSRIRLETTAQPDEDEIEEIETPSKRRKIHSVDLTNDRKPPIFINLLDIDDDDDDVDNDIAALLDEKPIITV